MLAFADMFHLETDDNVKEVQMQMEIHFFFKLL